MPAGGTPAAQALAVQASAVVPLLKDGRWVATRYAMHPEPRAWSESHRQVLREVAERTWSAVQHARALAAMRQGEARFRAMADLVPDLLGRMDDRSQAGWGHDVGEAMGLTSRRRRPDRRSSRHGEWMCRRAEGRVFFALVSLSVLRNEVDAPVGLLAVASDLSGRKALEALLRQRMHQAEAASLAMSCARRSMPCRACRPCGNWWR